MAKKYIRTETNIFEVVDENDLVYKVRAKRNPNNIYSKSKKSSDILFEGVTVGECLDEYVVDDGISLATFHNLKLAINTTGKLYGVINMKGGSKWIATYDKETKEWVLR